MINRNCRIENKIKSFCYIIIMPMGFTVTGKCENSIDPTKTIPTKLWLERKENDNSHEFIAFSFTIQQQRILQKKKFKTSKFVNQIFIYLFSHTVFLKRSAILPIFQRFQTLSTFFKKIFREENISICINNEWPQDQDQQQQHWISLAHLFSPLLSLIIHIRSFNQKDGKKFSEQNINIKQWKKNFIEI